MPTRRSLAAAMASTIGGVADEAVHDQSLRQALQAGAGQYLRGSGEVVHDARCLVTADR